MRRAGLRVVLLAAVAATAVWWVLDGGPGAVFGPLPGTPSGATAVLEAFEDGRSGVVVEVQGRVTRVLADDIEGSRHQRFILRLDGGHTLLVSHNIDLAPRVPLEVDDPVHVRGQYEWNAQGGVLHWTHHDPAGRRPGGWIRHRGRTWR